MPSVTPGGNLPSSLRWSMMVAVSCCGERISVAGTGNVVRIEGKKNGAKYRDPWWTLRTPDWGEGSPSNRTTTLSTQPRQRRSGFGTSLSMSLSGPARAWTFCRIFLVPFFSSVSQRSTDNSFDLMAWLLLWRALSTVEPYIDRCVPFQIMSNNWIYHRWTPIKL